MLNVQKYQTHDNGGRPFEVEIRNITQDKFIVKVTTNDEEIEESQKYSNVFYASQVFVGKSPLNSMTEFSGGDGSNYDGNSMLIKTNLNEYVFIGCNIFSFNTNSPVISYISPVGNNDVPYPYATLENGDIYLMIESVILSNTNALHTYLEDTLNDPYGYYYDKHNITPNISVSRTKNEKQNYLNNFSYYRNIKKFMIGGEDYNMTYNSNPNKDYDRLKTFENNDKNSTETNIEICVENDQNLNKLILTKEMYVDIIQSFGILNGFNAFNKTILCKRLW